jgi:hypothetical protein
MRVQHPRALQRIDRKGTYWFFRYWHDELLPEGSIRATRKLLERIALSSRRARLRWKGSVGGKWVYIRYRREARKFIPA